MNLISAEKDFLGKELHQAGVYTYKPGHFN